MHRLRHGPAGARVALAAALVVSLSRAAPPQGDQVKVTCAQAYETAQRLREGHRLREAREQLLVCARPECPALLRRDCAPWLGEVEAVLPSIVVVARTADGQKEHDV